MSEPFLSFEGVRVVGGYRWIEATRRRDTPPGTPPEWFLTDQPSARPGRPYELFHDAPAAFQEFGATPLDRDGILSFAERYGNLGGPHAPELLDVPGLHAVWGVSWARWQGEIKAMRLAAALWGAIQATREGDTDALRSIIRWTQPQRVEYFSPAVDDLPAGTVQKVIASRSPDMYPERLAWLRPGDLLAPALQELQRDVNLRLDEETATRLQWDDNHAGLRVQLVPRGLLGGVWLQLAHAIAANQVFRRCAQCGTWFAVHPGGRDTGRTSRQFCSESCRGRAYRGRIAEARRLAAQGATPEAIAGAVGSEAATVRGWLADSR